MASRGELRIGTSGWHYDHWIGRFYPEKARKADLLSIYTETFDSVEINNTFYQLPSPETLSAWSEQTGEGFLFACKGSRYITHMKKLKDPKESVARFFEVVDALGNKLGPILFQLPPNWRANAERLEAFLDGLPDGHRYAFEFRDESWFAPDVLAALYSHGAGLCIYELGDQRSPLEVTADFVYVRLHGPGEAYQGEYDAGTLAAWSRLISGWRDDGRDVFCYFDNDEKAYAAFNARSLLALVGRE